jgi:ABC-type glycerol-3-phosphate transport system substrate-binding protein
MSNSSLTRRAVLKAAALAPPAFAASSLAAPFVRGAYAAGKLTCAFWDHWVPGANDHLSKLCQEWGAKEKVEVVTDFMTSNGDKDVLTLMAEGQAKTGHDVIGARQWYAPSQAEKFEPVDDIVNDLIKEHGKVAQGAEYLGKINGRWIAVPTSVGSATLPPCARIDLFKEHVGLDVTKMYSASGVADKELVDNWTWDFFLKAAEKCHKAGFPFGLPLSTYTDGTNMVGAMFASYGVQLVDAKGNITVKSDATRQALEWFQRLTPFLPDSVYAWDNASNNKALISGQSALIFNPPSAWAVAVRDAPKVAEQLWTFHSPKGPKGRFDPGSFYYWGIWNFSKNIPAAKSLLRYLTTRDAQQKLVNGGQGFDIPPFEKFSEFPIWAEQSPPKGTMANYPPKGDVVASMAGYPAPPAIGTQMWAQATMCKMVVTCTQQKKSVNDAIAFAERELEGFMRS